MLDLIFGSLPTDTFIEIWQPDTNAGRRFFHSVAEVDDFLAQSTNKDSNTYFGVAARKALGSEKTDVYGTKVLWADIDNLDFPRATLPPSLIVHSGHGWHFYWVLNEWQTNIEAIERYNQLLAQDVGGDSVHNVNRLLRVPGTLNTKFPDSQVRAELRQKQMHIYKLSDFDILSSLTSQVRHKIRTGDRRGHGEDRSARDWAIIVDLVKASASDSLIEFIFEVQPCGDKYRDSKVNGTAYLKHSIEQAREKNTDPATGEIIKSKGGIFEGPDGYYVESAHGKRRLSTFILRPTLLLQGERLSNDGGAEDGMVCDVIARDFTWKDVTLTRSCFNDRHSLDKLLTINAWVWLGRDDDVRQLLPYLLHQWELNGKPKTKATNVLGRHGNYFIGPDQCITATEVFEGVKGPLVYLGPQRERPNVHYNFGKTRSLESVIKINLPTVMWPLLGWFGATPYKPILESLNARFPILNCFGTKGSGKTTALKLMQKLLGYAEYRMYDCTTTRFIKLVLLSSANAVPISFSEYRHSIADQILRYVLLAYDTGHDPRGKGDQSTHDYALSAPFTIDGEDSIADPAARERILAVHFVPEVIKEGSECHQAFYELPDYSNFAGNYIQWTLQQDVQAMLESTRAAIAIAFPNPLPDRVRNNITIAAFGCTSLCTFTGMPAPNFAEVFEDSLNAVWSSEMGRGIVLADEFTEAIVNAVAMKFHGIFRYKVEDNIVWFQLVTAFQWWLRQRQFTKQTTLDRDALRYQLMERHVEKEGKGQYIVGPKAIDGTWCYGISLNHAAKAGLDVPDQIDERRMVINL